ncbi:hypothetical protein [Actinoplanes utahensis]|uniref:Heavy metal-binding domain-containing protein n=1 Tax=Actinoplanes utahensis TaxID=1869 RepID=A0A0A6UR94_ACTUT|nr:hypothetical protein [Actinoplanes utahensis]KHD77951.1 hypothetical protein MB27_07405 [Actinoplanes utahensis]GIF29915.1 hypothetical protein Aut01nite_29010 [Actinoplanes utahensis]
MRTATRLSAYGAGLVLVFGAALGAGRVIGPDQAPAPAPAHTEGHADPAGSGETAGHGDGEHLPGGLQVAQDGYRLVPLTTRLSVGSARPFAFQVLGPDGKPVTGYTENHDRDLHLIVARRDLSGYQHLHPVLGADGTWSVPLAVNTPGQYRVLADFQATAMPEAITLGVDVPAPGDYQPAPLPAPARTAEVDGYTVTLTGDLRAGAAADLTLAVSRDGKPVTDLESYLGALGHLVVLRDGDLAYLHVHPTSEDALAFQAEVPSEGVYRLYLDFQHGGKVRTAEFTAATAAATAATAASAGAPSPAGDESPGHGSDDHTHD